MDALNLGWDETYAYLQQHGKEIGAMAKGGDQLCIDIIKWYTMLHRSPGDPGSRAFLIIGVEQYIDRAHKIGS